MKLVVATLFGIVVGPEGFGFVNPLMWDNIDKLTLEFARIVIALQVFAAGVTLPKAYLVKELTSLSILLLPVMFFMWLVSAVAIYYLMGLSFVSFLLPSRSKIESARVSADIRLHHTHGSRSSQFNCKGAVCRKPCAFTCPQYYFG